MVGNMTDDMIELWPQKKRRVFAGGSIEEIELVDGDMIIQSD